MFAVGESGPPLPPNLITPFPLSPLLSIIIDVASKSNVPALIVIAVPSIFKKLLAFPLAKKSPVPSK